MVTTFYLGCYGSSNDRAEGEGDTKLQGSAQHAWSVGANIRDFRPNFGGKYSSTLNRVCVPMHMGSRIIKNKTHLNNLYAPQNQYIQYISIDTC